MAKECNLLDFEFVVIDDSYGERHVEINTCDGDVSYNVKFSADEGYCRVLGFVFAHVSPLPWRDPIETGVFVSRKHEAAHSRLKPATPKERNAV